MNSRARERIEFEKWKWLNPHDTKGTGTGKGKQPTPPAVPKETEVGRFGTNSITNQMTVSELNPNKQVHVFSAEGMTSDIARLKRETAEDENKLKGLNLLLQQDPDNPLAPQWKLQKKALELGIVEKNSDLNERRQAYGAARDVALSRLTDEERAQFKEFEGKDEQFNGLKKKITELEKQYPGELTESGQTTTTLPVLEAQMKLKNVMRIKNKVDGYVNDFLTDIRQKQFFDTKSIRPNDKENQAITDIIASNHDGLQIFDDSGNPVKEKLDKPGTHPFKDPSFDDVAMTFAQGELSKYIKESQTKVIVEDVGPSTNLGDGHAVLKVRFEDPLGQIPKNKSYFIVTGDHQQEDIANVFANNKKQEVREIAASMVDRTSNNIRNQMAKAKTSREFTIMVDDLDGNKVPLTIRRVGDAGNIAVTGMVDGVERPFPVPEVNGTPGVFNGVDHLIIGYKYQMAKEKAAQQAAASQPK